MKKLWFQFQKQDIEEKYIIAKKCPQLQYTHAAIWAIIAFAILKQNNKAQELYNMINPIEHSKSKEKALRI